MSKPRCTTECAEDFKRVEAEKGALLTAVTRTNDFRWLIEAPGQQYLAVRRLGGIGGRYDFIWTGDHNKALAFRSQEQADSMMMAVRQMDREFDSHQNNGKLSWGKLFAFEPTIGNARAVEHGWMSPPATGKPENEG